MTTRTTEDEPNDIDLKPTVKKRRQHYVWRHYLDGWATDGKLWCRRDGKILNSSSNNVAHERDFYRLQEMSERDLAVVGQLMIEPLKWPLRELAEGWVPHFTELFRLKRLCQQANRLNARLEAEFDAHINNLEEDLHAKLETEAIPLLVALRNCDLRCFEDAERSFHYTWFLAAQYFRTPGMVARAAAALKDLQDFNAEAALGLLRTIMATNVGHGLWLRRLGLHGTFLRPAGKSTFITGEQPIVNARGVGLAPNTPPASLELYYPLLPNLAVLLNFDAKSLAATHTALPDDEIAAYNAIIFEMSNGRVYGVDRDAVA